MKTLLIAVAGMIATGGVLLVLRGIMPRALPLADMHNLSTSPRPRRDVDQSTQGLSGRSIVGNLEQDIGPRAQVLMGRVGISFDSSAKDLRVLQVSEAQFAFRKLSSALAGVMVPLLIAVMFGAGGLAINPTWTLLASFLGGIVGFVLPDVILGSAAANARKDFKEAFAAYLELVRMLLAGGMAMQSALTKAAQVGNGDAFDEIRRAIDRSSTRGVPIDVEFAELAEAAGLDDLALVASSIDLANSQGASPSDALASRAETIGDRCRYDERVDAEASTAKMPVPTALFVLGFMILLLAPAIQTLFASTVPTP